MHIELWEPRPRGDCVVCEGTYRGEGAAPTKTVSTPV